MKKIVKKAVKRKKQQPKIVRYYFDDTPQSYSHGGNVKNEYNQLVGRVGDEYYFLNYIFHHSDGFQGATGDVIMPVSKGYYDYAMSREGIIERYVDSMGEDEWIDVLGIDREEYEDEDKLIEAIEDGIYDLFLAGQLHPFEEVDYDAESEMRTLPKFQDSDEFPIFEVVGGGRIFSGDISFDDIYNQELYDKIKEVEGFKEGGELNKMVKIYYNSQIPFYKKDKNKYEIYENTPFVVVPKSKVNEVIHDHFVEGDWKNYLVPELMITEDKIIHHRKGGEKLDNGGGVNRKFMAGGEVDKLPSNLQRRLNTANKLLVMSNGRELSVKEAIRWNIDNNSESGFVSGQKAIYLVGGDESNIKHKDYYIIGDALIDISTKMTGVTYDLYDFEIEKYLQGKGNKQTESQKETALQRMANGGGVSRERFNLSFNYNPSNLSNEDAKKIVKQYTNDWKHNNDFDNVSFYVFNLTKDKADELKVLLKMEDVYNIEIQKSNYAKGGAVEKVRISVLNELYNLRDEGVTQVQLNGFNESIGYVIGLRLDDTEIKKVGNNAYITLYKKGGEIKEWENSMKKRNDIEFLRIEKTEALPNNKLMVYYAYNPIGKDEFKGTKISTDVIKFVDGGGEVEEKYKVVKVFRKSGRREILEKNLTLEEARRVVSRYPNSNTSMVVFMKMYANGGEAGYMKKGEEIGEDLENYSNYDEFYNVVFDYIKREENLTEEETKDICIVNESIIEAEFEGGSSPRFTGDVVLGYLSNERGYMKKGGKAGNKKQNKEEKRFSVWVGGTEVNDYYLTEKEAKNLAFEYEDDGYDDVVIADKDEYAEGGEAGEYSEEVEKILENLEPEGVKFEGNSREGFSVLVKDKNSDFSAFVDVYMQGSDVTSEWNQYIFAKNNSKDMLQSDLQDNVDIFDYFTSEAIQYLEEQGAIKQDDNGDWSYTKKYAEGGGVGSEMYMLLYDFVDEKMIEGDSVAESMINEKGYSLTYDELYDYVDEKMIEGDSDAKNLLNRINSFKNGGEAGNPFDDEDIAVYMLLYDFVDEKMIEGDSVAESMINEKGYSLTFDEILLFVYEKMIEGDSDAKNLLNRINSFKNGGEAGKKSIKKPIRKKPQPKIVRQYFEDRPYSYAGGGGTYVDLFEDYENIPLKVQKIFDKYAEEFGDDFGGMDYKDTQNMLEEIEEVGYTFGYGLDNQPYGLRPMGVRLNQLKSFEDYDDDDYAEGGEVQNWMEEALASLIEETGNDDLEILIVSDNGNEFIATDDNVEYRVFKTEEDAEEKAIEQVLQDLEEMPESFNQEWLSNFFEAENFFREILEEYNYGYATDIMTEDDDLYANRLIREMIDWGIMTKEQAMNSDAEQIASDNIQDFVNLLTDDQCTNGAFEYYENQFGKEEAYNIAISNNLLDFQEASENAVMLDGIGHFLSSYDGITIYLTSNSVAYRTN